VSDDPRPRDTGGGRTFPVKVLLVAAGVLAACGVVNPVSDEWVCSEGKAPAGNDCYREGSTLPPGVAWHPFGNRPLPYNCDKDGWVLIERPVTRRGVSDEVQDCVREGTELPGRWHTVQQD
jgi:hypothetical protein